jgi:hypothetical protein
VTTLTSSTGNLTDGSGSFDYRNKSLCRYKLEPTGAKSISITFNQFNTAGEGDYIEFFDLETQNSLYKIYGQTNPGTLNFNTGKLYFIFLTDQQNTAPGWDFSYTSSELTGLNEHQTGIDASVFPNPAQNQLQVNVNTSGYGFTLKLVSAEGITVYKDKSQAGNSICRIDVSALPRGIYVLQISSEKGTTYQKVVLN